MTDCSNWHSMGHDDEPLDQQRELDAPGLHGIWGEVGPESPDGWSWSVTQFGDADPFGLAGGFAPDEASAKKQVDDWEASANQDHDAWAGSKGL